MREPRSLASVDRYTPRRGAMRQPPATQESKRLSPTRSDGPLRVPVARAMRALRAVAAGQELRAPPADRTDNHTCRSPCSPPSMPDERATGTARRNEVARQTVSAPGRWNISYLRSAGWPSWSVARPGQPRLRGLEALFPVNPQVGHGEEQAAQSVRDRAAPHSEQLVLELP